MVNLYSDSDKPVYGRLLCLVCNLTFLPHIMTNYCALCSNFYKPRYGRLLYLIGTLICISLGVTEMWLIFTLMFISQGMGDCYGQFVLFDFCRPRDERQAAIVNL